MCTTIQCKEEDKNTFFLDNSIFMLSMDYFSYFAYWNYRIVQYFRYINIYNYRIKVSNEHQNLIYHVCIIKTPKPIS